MMTQTTVRYPFAKQKFVFVDASVPDVDTLTRNIKSGVNIYVLEAMQDGVQQITQILQESVSQISEMESFTEYALSVYSGIEIHIVAHGAPGALYLGNAELSLDSLDAYLEDLKTWVSVGSEPQLFIYACNVAAGDAGAELMTQLSHVTGATIYASTQKIGSVDRGGTWSLDVVVQADTPSSMLMASRDVDFDPYPFSADARASYAGILMPSPILDLDATDSATVVVSDDFDSASDLGGTGWSEGWDRSNNTKVLFSGGALQVRDPDRNGQASRKVDLSGISNPTISLDYATSNLDAGSDEFIFEYSSDDGITWNTLETFDGNSSGSRTYNLPSGQGSADTIFRVGFTGGSGNNAEYFTIDNLSISGIPFDTSVSYVWDDPAVAIASNNVSITDISAVTSATITLANAEAEDVLAINGALPSDISASSYDPNSGIITLTNTGTATVSDFETAIAQITFSSTSLEAADRIIELSVTDGSNISNTAISTIEVDLPDPPQIDLSSSMPLTFSSDPTLEAGSQLQVREKRSVILMWEQQTAAMLLI